MNLKQFLDYRTHCPLCNRPLTAQLYPNRAKNITEIVGNRFSSHCVMKGKKPPQKSYRIIYSFDMISDQFQIDFYADNTETRYEVVHPFMTKRFMALHNNFVKTNHFLFQRQCVSCETYRYYSQPVVLDFKKGSYGSLLVAEEAVQLSYPIGEEVERRFMLENDLINQQTELTIWLEKTGGLISNINQELSLPLIPFVSKEETLQRLNNLVPFT